MNYVGIDIAKLNHFASVINSDGEVLVEPFEFTNDFDGFHKLLHKLDPFEPDSLIIGLESTAHYGNNLLDFLVPRLFNVCVLLNFYRTVFASTRSKAPTSSIDWSERRRTYRRSSASGDQCFRPYGNAV